MSRSGSQWGHSDDYYSLYLERKAKLLQVAAFRNWLLAQQSAF